MDVKKLLGYGIVAFGVYEIYGVVKVKNALDISLDHIYVGGTVLNPSVELQLLIFNPTSTSITLSDLTGAVYINGTTQQIGDVINVQSLQILPNTTVNLNIPVNLYFTGLVSTLLTIMQTKGNRIIFKGTMNVDGLPFVPFEKEYKVGY